MTGAGVARLEPGRAAACDGAYRHLTRGSRRGGNRW
jgi:hypothetical protein